MADEDNSQKTEDPTPRRIAKARQKGQVGTSMEVKNWAVLLGALMSLALIAPWASMELTKFNSAFIEYPEAIAINPNTVRALLIEVLLKTGVILSPLFLLLMLLAFAASVGQSGFLWSTEKIAPKMNKISIIAGTKRMFSARAMVEFLKGLIKLSLVTTLMWAMAVPFMQDLELMPGFAIIDVLDRLFLTILAVTAGSILVMTAVAILDYAYQKFDYIKSLRMSRQEIKDEHKDSEGDPQIKARIRKIRAERAQSRMMAAVPDADVVITNPTHYAIALEYKMDAMAAPRLVAKGIDHLALRIREVATEHDVPIVENPPLARVLYSAVEIDEEIPVEHYKAVAEVIGYVMRLKGELPVDEDQRPDPQ